MNDNTTLPLVAIEFEWSFVTILVPSSVKLWSPICGSIIKWAIKVSCKAIKRGRIEANTASLCLYQLACSSHVEQVMTQTTETLFSAQKAVLQAGQIDVEER